MHTALCWTSFCQYSYPRLVLLAYNYEQVGSVELVDPMDGSVGTVDE
jgi:hypothetical protein